MKEYDHEGDELHHNTNIGNILSSLNDEQKSAVTNVDGPLLVLAGAGTGKTKVLTTRIAYIVHNHHAVPSEILAVTFTNKAANEMRIRISSMIGNAANMWIGTFHSIGARILRIYYAGIGLDKNFVIADESDKNKILQLIATEMNVDKKRYPTKLLNHIISNLKEKCIHCNDIEKISTSQYRGLNVATLYNSYQTKLKMYNMVDFDDLIFQVILLFKNQQELLNDFRDRFKYILVDEYQDTGQNQHQMLMLLAGNHNNICCVGDEDQSIYSWRGADIRNIMNFSEHFQGANIVRLEINYRSTNNILNTATNIIKHNTSRYGKTLRAFGETGAKIDIIGVRDHSAESYQMCSLIKDRISRNLVASYNNIAILVRNSHQMRSIEESFINEEIPYKILDGVRFYDRKEIKDVIAYLRFTYSQNNFLAFDRIMDIQKCGVGEKTIELIRRNATQHDGNIINTLLSMISIGEIGPKSASLLQHFIHQVKKWNVLMHSNELSISNIIEQIITQSGYIDVLESQSEIDDNKNRINNIKELQSMVGSFESLDEFFEHISLFGERNTDNINQDAVNIMTMHAAKGLEFDFVFLPGWEEGLFPSHMSIDDNGDAGIEEERRLAYVAITRARKHLAILYADSRFIYGKWNNTVKSRFVNEILENADKNSFQHNRYGKITDQNTYSSERKFIKSSAAEKTFQQSTIDPIYANKVRSSTSNIKESESYAIGNLVSHTTFGNGAVTNLMGHFVEVKFNDGTKRLIQKSFLKKV